MVSHWDKDRTNFRSCIKLSYSIYEPGIFVPDEGFIKRNSNAIAVNKSTVWGKKDGSYIHNVKFKELLNTHLLSLLFLFLALCSCHKPATTTQPPPHFFTWDTLPDLAPFAGATQQDGLGGAFAGTHNGAIIMAGGTNFGGGYFWEGAQKQWFDQIMVLPPDSNTWQQQSIRLPGKWSYGVSISTAEGVILIGGRDESTVSRKVFRLQWDQTLNQVNLDTLPDLPTPLCFMSGALSGNTIYVAGGLDALAGVPQQHFYSLDISEKGLENDWQTLPPWPGKPRLLPVAAAQSNGETDCFYLFSGQFPRKGQTNEYLTDAFEYNPATKSWRQRAAIQPGKGPARCVFAAPGIDIGANHIAIFGGVSGEINTQLENLNLEIDQTRDTALIAQLEEQKTNIYRTHPGFPKTVLLYHTITDSWTTADEMPYDNMITTNIFRKGDQLVIPNGEIRPGVRTNRVVQIGMADRKAAMYLIDYGALLLYTLVLIWMGWYFARRQKSTDDYFKGGGRIPWWAAALSLFGTGLSAITFMAVPAKTFATNWAYLVLSLSIILIPPLVSRVFIPVYRKYNLTSSFEYLRLRFNQPVQLLGAFSFLLFQLGRVGIILYLPALALNVVAGIDIILCILVVGLISLVYTLMGGIEAVVWTDVFQVIVLMGGALISVVLMLGNMEGGLGQLIQLGIDQHKFEIFNMAFDLRQPTFWVVLLGGFFSYLITYGTDQTMVQRYLSTADVAAAQRSIWTNAILALPAIVLFFFIGTLLYGFYQQYPHELPPGMAPDAVFASFIIRELPMGMAGVLIAAIFAAAMSSISSSINSAATVYAIDCHPTWSRHPFGLRDARIASLLFGLAGTAFALLLANADIKSIWDEFLKIIGLLTGGLGGVFLLGMITKRANGRGALLGLLASAGVQYWVSTQQVVHLLLFTATGFVSAFVLGYLFSLVLREVD